MKQKIPLTQIEPEIKKIHHPGRNLMLSKIVHKLFNQEHELTPDDLSDIRLENILNKCVEDVRKSLNKDYYPSKEQHVMKQNRHELNKNTW